MRLRVLISSFLVVVTGVLVSCGDSSVGPTQNDLPFPTEAEHDGLLFGLYSTVTGGEWVLGVWAKNVSDERIEEVFPGGCMMTGLVAYREGAFDDPVWEFNEMPGGGGCATTSQKLDILSGRVKFPRGWRTAALPAHWILGDSLEAGSYRLSAQVVQIGGEIGGPSVGLIAPHPVHLKRSE